MIVFTEGGLPLFCNANPAGMCWNGTKYKEIDNVDTRDDSIENQGSFSVLSINRLLSLSRFKSSCFL